LSIKKSEDSIDIDVEQDYGWIYGVDARLLKLDENTFVMSNNRWIDAETGSKEKIDLRSGKTCDNGCMLIETRLITVSKGGRSISASKGKILCPEISHTTEKNWAFWKTIEDRLVFSYGLSPHHEVFSLKRVGNSIQCDGIRKIYSKNDFFKRFEKYYKGIVYVSVSTPALLQENGKYLALGHIKYKYRKIEDSKDFTEEEYGSGVRSSPERKIVKFKNTRLARFHKKLLNNDKKFHPSFVYLMFLYEFEPVPPYEVTRISSMFIPESPYALSFPSNLTYSPELDSYIISYGDYDSRCKMLIMSPKQVKNALKPISSPRNVKFEMIKPITNISLDEDIF